MRALLATGIPPPQFHAHIIAALWRDPLPLRSPSKAVGQTKTGWLDVLFSRVPVFLLFVLVFEGRPKKRLALGVTGPSPRCPCFHLRRAHTWTLRKRVCRVLAFFLPHEGRPRLRLPVMFPGWKQGLGRVSQNGNKGLVWLDTKRKSKDTN